MYTKRIVLFIRNYLKFHQSYRTHKNTIHTDCKKKKQSVGNSYQCSHLFTIPKCTNHGSKQIFASTCNNRNMIAHICCEMNSGGMNLPEHKKKCTK